MLLSACATVPDVEKLAREAKRNTESTCPSGAPQPHLFPIANSASVAWAGYALRHDLRKRHRVVSDAQLLEAFPTGIWESIF